jgi:cell division protein FtsW
MFTKQKVTHDAAIIQIIVATLLIVGIIFIYSSSSFYSIERYGTAFYYVRRQLIGLGLGLFAYFAGRHLPLKLMNKTSLLSLVGALILTLLPLMNVIGRKIHGSHRWINIFGFTFQPSECLKVAMVIYIASFLARKRNELHSLKKSYIPVLAILGIVTVVLLKQPDFGCAVTISATTLCMLFLANVNLKYLGYTVLASLPGLLTLAYLQPYRWRRILTYLDPWKDPQGSGFQIIQSLIAVGSGGLWGTGIAQSQQKFFYLPMQHTDFIFSIIAEEIGFIGSVFLITLFGMFTFFGFKISWSLENLFSVYLVQGITILITLQSLINIFVSTGLAPTKGIGLPFISYGNTALICNLFMVGLMMNTAHDFYE